jgi:DNA-binding response OmpR family regulator
MYRILIVAPDLDLRRSLQFALEAEGYAVDWRASIGATEMPYDFDCTVVDHHALGNDAAPARAFLQAFQPVILLANAQHELSASAYRTVLKPHLGLALTNAIRDALRGNS